MARNTREEVGELSVTDSNDVPQEKAKQIKENSGESINPREVLNAVKLHIKMAFDLMNLLN